MLAASLFVSASVLWWDWVKVSAGEDFLEYFSSCVMSGGLRAGIFFLVGLGECHWRTGSLKTDCCSSQILK